MSMTNGEAASVNVLLRAIGVTTRPGTSLGSPSEHDVIVAATSLATSARKKLMAGVGPDEVERWSLRRVVPRWNLFDHLDHLRDFDPDVFTQIGPHFTCEEADTFARLLLALDRRGVAEAFLKAHVAADEDSDPEHGTLELVEPEEEP